MLTHGVAPSGLLLSTMIPVPKYKRASKSDYIMVTYPIVIGGEEGGGGVQIYVQTLGGCFFDKGRYCNTSRLRCRLYKSIHIYIHICTQTHTHTPPHIYA